MILSCFRQVPHRRIAANSLLRAQYFSNQSGRPSRATSEVYRQARAIREMCARINYPKNGVDGLTLTIELRTTPDKEEIRGERSAVPFCNS
jgi:hypothetical protein